MARVDASIPLQVRAPKLGDLADSYLLSQRMVQQNRLAQQEAQLKAKQIKLAENQDTREVAKETRDQRVHDEMLTDLATKRKDAHKQRINQLFGEEAETLASLPSEKRSLYYHQYMLPNLTEAGFDTNDMPEYDDSMIHAWRMKALDADQRSTERMAANKATNMDAYDMKIDGETGKYYYTAKDPRSGLPDIPTDKMAPPQIGFGQGETGPRAFVMPRSGAAGESKPLITPGGNSEGRPLTNIPESVKSVIRDNSVVLKTVNDVTQLIDNAETSGTGPWQSLANSLGFVGRVGLQLFDEKGAPSRQLIGKLSSLKMKDISGAVINAHEHPRLATWIPQLEDTKPVVLQKLKHFALEVQLINEEMAAQYSKNQGYKPDPVLEGKGANLKASPLSKKVITEADLDSMSDEELQNFVNGGQ